jgi:hypothetical protein
MAADGAARSSALKRRKDRLAPYPKAVERPVLEWGRDIIPSAWFQAACNLSKWEGMMESDRRFYQRRVSEETLAKRRAITPEARERHEELLRHYKEKVREFESS